MRVYQQGSKTDDQIETEIKFITYLIENDFPVPKIYSNSNGDLLTKIIIDTQEWQVILTEKINGRKLPQYTWIIDDELFENIVQTYCDLDTFGNDFASSHLIYEYNTQVSDNKIGRVLVEKLDQLKTVDFLDTQLKEIISNIKSTEYQYSNLLPMGYVDDAIDTNNLILGEDGEIYVINFGDMHVRPCVSGIGSCLFAVILSAFELDEDIQKSLQKYIDKYCDIGDFWGVGMNHVMKPIELNIDFCIVSEIFTDRKLTSKIEGYLRLKSEISKLKFEDTYRDGLSWVNVIYNCKYKQNIISLSFDKYSSK